MAGGDSLPTFPSRFLFWGSLPTHAPLRSLFYVCFLGTFLAWGLHGHHELQRGISFKSDRIHAYSHRSGTVFSSGRLILDALGRGASGAALEFKEVCISSLADGILQHPALRRECAWIIGVFIISSCPWGPRLPQIGVYRYEGEMSGLC